MTKILLIMGIFSIFGANSKKLTQKETELINKLNFDIDLLTVLKKETKSELKQLPEINEYGEVTDELYNGIHSKSDEEKGKEIVKKLKKLFKKKGYLIFLFEGENEFSVAVIKGNDELEILKYRRTDGINYSYENEDIIKKISEWKDKYGITVIGCGRDWLEVKFDKLPSDLDAFANEVYEFCPDSVDQGVREVENLKQLIKEMHGLWLWWD
jgi:hypothetical protein